MQRLQKIVGIAAQNRHLFEVALDLVNFLVEIQVIFVEFEKPLPILRRILVFILFSGFF
jgi:hypothetical protein